jgi:hypothetical protein
LTTLEHRAGGADAQGKREHGDRGEAGALPQLANAVSRVAHHVGQHSRSLFHAGVGVGGQVDSIGEAIQSRLGMSTICQPDVLGESFPVADLAARVGISVGVAESAGEGVAVEVFQLRGELAHDPGFTLRRQPWQNQPGPDERRPVTHCPLPGRR